MGGDGGVIASNRKYMRGAGSADQTADYGNRKKKAAENAEEVMSTCCLTKVQLHAQDVPIVACPYGRLYVKEAAVQALLRRKTHGTDELGAHIRGMSDLYSVRFQLEAGHAVCPVTGKALKGSVPAVLIVPGNADANNVLSESAFAQLPGDEMEAEYGPIQRKVRLAPPPQILKEVEARVEKEHAEEAARRKAKKDKKKDKKRKRGDQKDGKGDKDSKRQQKQQQKQSSTNSSKHKPNSITAANAARSKVGAAAKSNSVLDSLFTTNDRKLSDKEKKDRLVARG